ncbi:sugar phosphate isomerase/epimerase family protein [Dyadobacter sediminis]|nr:TIM barrel protein [Dyadobacter sediminis]
MICKKSMLACLFLLFATVSNAQNAKGTNSIFARENLIAWCIVPYDVKNRTPAERSEMLNKLGITMLAYDWREKHVPEFDTELDELEKHHIALQAFWLYSGPNPENDKNLDIIIDLLKRHQVKTQIWCMVAGIEDIDSMTQEEKVKVHAKAIAYIADKAAEIGCSVGLYNHGGWYGEPENQLEIIRYLKKPNIGIVYNFHHAEEQIDRFPEFFPRIVPHLMALNLAGLKKGNPVKVVPIGEGDAEPKMMQIVKNSKYHGPIGIINEDTAPDAEEGLTVNINGLKKVLKQMNEKEALKTYQ